MLITQIINHFETVCAQYEQGIVSKEVLKRDKDTIINRGLVYCNTFYLVSIKFSDDCQAVELSVKQEQDIENSFTSSDLNLQAPSCYLNLGRSYG